MADILAPGSGNGRESNGRFGAGNPGKPKGAKSKGIATIRASIERAITQEHPSGDGTMLDVMVDKQVVAATNGDLAAFLAIMAYYVGKPRQAEPDKDGDATTALASLIKQIAENPQSGFRPNADMIGSAEKQDIEGEKS